MAKKNKSEEQEVVQETHKDKKPKSYVKRWFDDYAVNNKADIKIVCDLTARSMEEQFNMCLKSGNTEVYAVTYYASFMALLELLKQKQKQYNNFTIQICNSINIGYTNNDDENNEKVGNFFPVLEFIGVNRNIIDSSTEIDPERTSQNLIRWKELNIKKNIEFIKQWQEHAYQKLLAEFKTDLKYSEACPAIFCIFSDNILNYIKLKYKELDKTDVSEVSMNVLGLYDIFYSYDEEDDKDIVECVPGISVKLALKNDNIASRE